MGGLGPIYYSSLSQYARDHGISLSDFNLFRRFIIAMDAEYLEHVGEMQRIEEERRKAAENQNQQ